MVLRISLFLAALVLLGVNGIVHGLYTDRWQGLTEKQVLKAQDNLELLPLKLPSWEGRILGSNETVPEEIIGKNISVRYIHSQSGKIVTIYLSCARSKVLLGGHTPMQCYPANGFVEASELTPVEVPVDGATENNTFNTIVFSKGETGRAEYLRIFWGWLASSGGWKTLDNPGKAFYRSPFLYKMYVMRPMIRPEEPLEGDPCIDLLKELIPAIQSALNSESNSNS